MNLEQLTELFKWFSIINIGLLMLSTILIASLKNLMYKIHGKLFNLDEKDISLVAYQYLGMYKVLIMVFNVTPYLAFLLIN